MEDKPKISIYLENPSQVKVESGAEFIGRPVDLLFDVDEFKTSSSRATDLGNLIVSILSAWHPHAFDAAVPPVTANSPVFGELEIVESLIARSVRRGTTMHSATIEDLLLHHTGSDKEDIWRVLAEDWPRIRARIKSAEKI